MFCMQMECSRTIRLQECIILWLSRIQILLCNYNHPSQLSKSPPYSAADKKISLMEHEGSSLSLSGVKQVLHCMF